MQSHTINTSRVQSILLRLPNWLGDSVMVSPAFEWLKVSFPLAEFSIVGTRAGCGIYERDRRVKHIFIDETKQASSRILATIKLAKTIGKHDLCITFSNTFFSALLLYFTKSPLRIGYARNARSLFLTHAFKLKKYNAHGKKYHQVLLYLSLIAPLAQIQHAIKADLPSLSTQDEILSHLATKQLSLISHRISLQHDKPAIGINPGAAFGSAKRWEQEYFIEVISYFLSKEYAVYMFGTSAESSANTDIAKAISTHVNAKYFYDLTDKTNINELIDYIRAMSVFITNDSGPLHIATALHTPLVAIFGSTDIKETAPYTPTPQKHIILLYKALSCSPCKKRECPLKHHECMKSISPKEVITSTEKLLENQPKRLPDDN